MAIRNNISMRKYIFFTSKVTYESLAATVLYTYIPIKPRYLIGQLYFINNVIGNPPYSLTCLALNRSLSALNYYQYLLTQCQDKQYKIVIVRCMFTSRCIWAEYIIFNAYGQYLRVLVLRNISVNHGQF